MKYSDDDQKILKVLKMNQEQSSALLSNRETATTAKKADNTIESSMQLLRSLGYDVSSVPIIHKTGSLTKVVVEDFETLATEAATISDILDIRDVLSEEDLQNAYNDLNNIDRLFSNRTSIINKLDLKFLAVAIALQVAKVMITPYIKSKFGYGDSFKETERLDHDDSSIKKEHKEGADKFRDKNNKHQPGYWINLLYQTPPYDTTVGSPHIGVNMEGRFHRLHTLGHDPILGWLFGTTNILTDIVTLNTFVSYRVERIPKMHISKIRVSNLTMFNEAREMIKADKLNLPAALFAEYLHLKSDHFTKCGLPIPVLEVFNPELAGKLYKNQYDALCLARDMKMIAISAQVSMLIDMIIGLIHGLYYDKGKEPNRDLFEARTRKILLISNTIAATSTIIRTIITKNPKDLDIGSLLVTVIHLFVDIKFITRIKQEFIESQIFIQVQNELREIDEMITSMS
ncbi:MAG: hypothetical protein AB9835_01800 [Eubacteriales bacterium]